MSNLVLIGIAIFIIAAILWYRGFVFLTHAVEESRKIFHSKPEDTAQIAQHKQQQASKLRAGSILAFIGMAALVSSICLIMQSFK